MGSAGLEWDSNDQPEQARLNQKTTFVGTGAQISGLGTTYAGQQAYCTSTGSGFTADVLYIRNAANSAWIDNGHVLSNNITEETEASTTPVTDDAETTPTAGTRYYAFFTMPSTEPLYLITGIEWKNGTAVAGNVQSGVDVVDADPPTVGSTPLIALATEVAQSGTSTVQRVSNVWSNPIRAGTVLGAWAQFSDGATATFRWKTGAGSQVQQKATSYNNEPPASETTAGWSAATTNRIYLKVYYKGYY